VVYAAKAAAANAPVSAARARALVVDDEEAARYVLRARLAAMPFVTLEATGAEEALRLARDEAPDVVLLDLRLGGESGLDVLDALRTDPRTRDIPVLAVTAAVLSDEERGRLASRRVPVLSKQALSQPHAEVVLREAMARAGWHARAAAAVAPAGPP
jgi:CheY-like chemotaxis protein